MLSRVDTASKTRISPNEPPENLKISLPGWLRERHPDLTGAIDSIVDYNEQLQKYVVELKSSIDDLNNRLRSINDSG